MAVCFDIPLYGYFTISEKHCQYFKVLTVFEGVSSIIIAVLFSIELLYNISNEYILSKKLDD